jgi:formate dehydrogenase maturation protein FdhE
MSLDSTSTGGPAVCGTCGGTRVTSVAMTLTDGSPVDFVSCRACESKSWTQAGQQLDISTVLGKAQKHKP